LDGHIQWANLQRVPAVLLNTVTPGHLSQSIAGPISYARCQVSFEPASQVKSIQGFYEFDEHILDHVLSQLRIG
jgi:hypothetical protein